MRAFDRSGPLNKERWVFLFVERYRELCPEVGERHGKLRGVRGFADSGLKPEEAAQKAVT